MAPKLLKIYHDVEWASLQCSPPHKVSFNYWENGEKKEGQIDAPPTEYHAERVALDAGKEVWVGNEKHLIYGYLPSGHFCATTVDWAIQNIQGQVAMNYCSDCGSIICVEGMRPLLVVREDNAVDRVMGMGR